MEASLRILPHLFFRDLTNPLLLQARYADMEEDYYWSKDFSLGFYVAQAQAGFMAVTEMHQGNELLLLELQRSYALLDFADLHAGRHARRILDRNRPTLHVSLSLRIAAEKIHAYHPRSWITPRYLETLEAVNAQHGDLHVVSVLLRHERDITAGEIGYILGRTYTSLSGFSSRDPRYRHHGTVQMVMLGRWLEQYGFAFWNLGQPYMPYKFALGAREYSRQAFLDRWLLASGQPLLK